MVRRKIDLWKRAFFWTGGIFLFIILILILTNVSKAQSIKFYQERQNEMHEEYEYKCEEGLKKVCIDENKRYVEYGEDETYVICDTDRKEIAICVSENYNLWTTCEEGNIARCIDTSKDWTQCWESNENAICVKEDIEGTISSSGYYSSCAIGEYSYCQ